MRIKGLDCLVSILKCMVEWSKDLYVNPHSQSNLTQDSSSYSDDTDSGKGTSPSLASCETNSLSSSTTSIPTLTASSSGNALALDNPEQFEVRKQQKELWQNGIEM